VKYVADGATEEKWVIIEDCADPKSERNEYSPQHGLARELLGKKVGDEFFIRRDEVQDRIGRITGIFSKYAYRNFEIIDSWEDRFQERFFVRKYSMQKMQDGSPDPATIFRALDQLEERKKGLNAIYRDNPVSVTSFAKLTGRGILECLVHIVSEEDLPVRCCLGNSEEIQEATEAFRSAKVFVIDPSAIATLFFAGSVKHLSAMSASRVVCESTLDEYREFQKRLSSPSQGFTGKKNGKYLFRSDEPAEREAQKQRVTEFLKNISTLALIESGLALAELEPKVRSQLLEVFDQPTAEAIATAHKSGGVLWTDDFTVSYVAKELLGLRRVWSQLVFKQCAIAGTLPAQAVFDLTLFLLNWRYFFTLMEPGAALQACHEASWRPDVPPLAAVIAWFGASEIAVEGLLGVSAEIIRQIWTSSEFAHQREAVTRAIIQSVLRRADGLSVATALEQSCSAFFGIDIEKAMLCRGAIRAAIEGMGASGLILPKGLRS
jgi:hypothetical protein